MYFQILLPVYQFNLHVQKTESNISEVLPLLATLIESKLKRMDVTGSAKALCVLIIKAIEKKFAYELSSNVYMVASLFDTKNLGFWTKRSFSAKYIRQALNSLVDVAVEFLPKENSFECESTDENGINVAGVDLNNPVFSQEESQDTYAQMLRSSSVDLNEINRVSSRSDLESEKAIFLNLIKDKCISANSTTSFWKRFQSKLPNLSIVARQLLNIPASSAFIERFFSICGVVCTQRRGRMDEDMIIKRSMLKVNLDLLTSFTEKK